MTALSLPIVFFWVSTLLAVVAVILLFLLKPPVLQALVSSNVVWKQVIRVSQALNDRWRWWLSLLLATLILLLLLFAIYRPDLSEGEGRNKVILVIDNSPTMAARMSNGISRLDMAKNLAQDFLSELPGDRSVLIVDTQRSVAIPEFTNIALAKTILDGIEIGTSLDPVVPSKVSREAAEHRFVFTDGVLLGAPPDSYETVSVFEPISNVGITHVDFALVPGNPGERQAFVELKNAGFETQVVELDLNSEAGESLKRKIEIKAGEKIGQILNISSFSSGAVRVSATSGQDGFRFDDKAFDYLSSKKEIKVLLVSQNSADDKLLELLELMPRVDVQAINAVAYSSTVADELQPDLLIFNRVVPESRPNRPTVIFGVKSAKWLPVQVTDAMSTQVEVVKNSAHPLMQNVSLRDLIVEGGVVFGGVTDAIAPFLSSKSEGALAVTLGGVNPIILFGFDAETSNIELLADFPILLANLLTWMGDEPAVIRASPGIIAIPGDAVRVNGMDGKEYSTWTVADQTYFNAIEAGLYTITTEDGPLRVAVSQVAEKFSDVNQSRISRVVAADLTAPNLSGGFSLAVILCLLAFSLLVLDWTLFHRRVTQ